MGTYSYPGCVFFTRFRGDRIAHETADARLVQKATGPAHGSGHTMEKGWRNELGLQRLRYIFPQLLRSDKLHRPHVQPPGRLQVFPPIVDKHTVCGRRLR